MTLVYLAAAWLLGIVASALTDGVWWPAVAAIAVAGVAGSIVGRRWQLAAIGLLCAGLFAGGGARFEAARIPDDPQGIARYNDSGDVPFRAIVTDDPEDRGRSERVRLSVREVFIGGAWRDESGGVLLERGHLPRLQYGDVVEITGELETPPTLPDFDYRDYLARHGIGSTISYPELEVIAHNHGNPAMAAVYSVRRDLSESIERALPEPQAALAQGMLLGERSSIPPDLTEDMNATGTSHLIAISGQNITLVAALVISALAWLIGRRPAAVVALATIAFYTMLSGASPTVVRAAIMGGLFVLATLVGRPGSAATSIALAAAIMAGVSPLVIEDVSFQLSFAAIAGIVYITPALQREAGRLWQGGTADSGLPGSLVEALAVTGGALLATMPLFALHFERISVIAPIANLVVVPAFPLILVSSAVTAVSGALWEPLGRAAAFVSWASLTYLIEAAHFLASVPLASFEIRGFGRGHTIGAYIGLAAGVLWLNRRSRVSHSKLERVRLPTLRIRPAWIAAGGLALAAVLAWWAVLDDSSDRLSVSILDVGQGDAILIETPDGQHVLLDGGASGQAVTRALGQELPFWEHTIDLVILSHPQEDHLSGLVTVLERYDVEHVLAAPVSADTGLYRQWRQLIDAKGIPYEETLTGGQVDLGDGARIDVLGPATADLAAADLNDASLVLRLSYGDASFLLTGDIEQAGEDALLGSGANLQSTVLKVAHHGSSTSSTSPFVSAVRPEVAVVSVGAHNPYGHPSPGVLERFDDAVVLRTDERGNVRLSTDGEHLWVDSER